VRKGTREDRRRIAPRRGLHRALQRLVEEPMLDEERIRALTASEAVQHEEHAAQHEQHEGRLLAFGAQPSITLT